MIFNLFGKGGNARQTAAHKAGAAFPWDDAEDFMACNFAFGDLVQNLQLVLTIDGRVHAETYMAAAGAIAGFAAQRSVFEELRRKGAGIQLATTKAGKKFYFGDDLNDALLAKTQDQGELRVWSCATGGAIAAGLPPQDVPDVREMFRHVSTIIAHDAPLLPSLGNHPAEPVDELLKHVWPLARKCFRGELSGALLPAPQIVSMPNRPVVAAQAAKTFILRVKGVLDPKIALTILMESAIFASKLPPEDYEAAQ